MSKVDVEEFAKRHPVGFCKMPNGFAHLPVLGVSREFMAPSRIDLRDLCTKTEDQGTKPWCAAYAAAQWAENIKWRVKDHPDDVDPTPIYRYAKTVDGDPNGDGTTLTAVLQALVTKGAVSSTVRGGKDSIFDGCVCKVRVLRASRLAFKYAIHKFGCCLGGFNISSAWWGVTKDAPVIGTNGMAGKGGHAVLVCGYDKQGVWIQNSWGVGWGEYGFAKIAWEEFDRECMYGAVLSNALDGLTV